MALRVEFHGREFVFVGDSLRDGGPLATAEAYREFRESYAHLYTDGQVFRRGLRIGTAADVRVIGPYEEPTPGTEPAATT